ncbi:uncharacterized protein N0V89_002038 [Didymosphaeria variabile]|uniref:Uncharacterized protein n=1 Tax=Didymosphaeria variabile TaxID=1932322 RepID=A0A9W8XSR0_9PLEO|nr:uncharacterized protein N0V89_002038 [Didymosphaeria variabile]KAJ4357463.1 hypothetical protein N0V89_002038 [Didymosphaeria variabile]
MAARLDEFSSSRGLKSDQLLEQVKEIFSLVDKAGSMKALEDAFMAVGVAGGSNQALQRRQALDDATAYLDGISSQEKMWSDHETFMQSLWSSGEAKNTVQQKRGALSSTSNRESSALPMATPLNSSRPGTMWPESSNSGLVPVGSTAPGKRRSESRAGGNPKRTRSQYSVTWAVEDQFSQTPQNSVPLSGQAGLHGTLPQIFVGSDHMSTPLDRDLPLQDSVIGVRRGAIGTVEQDEAPIRRLPIAFLIPETDGTVIRDEHKMDKELVNWLWGELFRHIMAKNERRLLWDRLEATNGLASS